MTRRKRRGGSARRNPIKRIERGVSKAVRDLTRPVRRLLK